MKKMMTMVAFATALMIGGSALAAPVDIFVRQTTATMWTIGARASVDNGGIALVSSGFTSIALCPAAQCPQISAPDSILAASGNITLTSNAGTNLVPLGGAELVLATLTGGAVTTIGDGDNEFGYTVVDQSLLNPLEFSLTVVPIVPEPATMVLFGLALAAMATVRRSA